MKRNTLDYMDFIFYSLFLNNVAYLIFRYGFFKTIGDLSVTDSHWVLVAIVLIAFIINFAITFRWGKNKKAVLATTLISYGLYTYFAYSKLIITAYICTIAIAVIVAVAYLVLIFWRRISNKQNRSKIIRNRKRRGYEGVRNIAACAGLVFMIMAFVYDSTTNQIAIGQDGETVVYGDEYALSKNIDMFLYLQPEEWEKLGDDLDMKMAVLSAVVNTEGRYLGFNKKITLYTKNLDEGTRGYYSSINNAIYLDKNHILNDSSRDVLESCLHECFHVAQDQYVDLYNSLDEEYKNMYFLMDAKQLAKEFDSYVDGKSNYTRYYSQECERSARAYGKASAQAIFDRIDEYLKDHESN